MKENGSNNNVFSMLSWFKAEKVNDAKVMVVGAGALGNEVLKNLALFGVGNIVIVDFDTIERSNLSRSVLFRLEDAYNKSFKAIVAANRIKEINPLVKVLPICGNLETGVGLGLYRQMDVIIGCLDNLQSRIGLNRLCIRAGKTWIDGGVGDLEGQVSVYQPGKSCYECNLTEEERTDFDRRISCAGVVKMNENAGRVATTPVSASIIAAIQVQEAMKIIHKDDIDSGVFSSLAGKLFVYEGMHPSFEIYDFATDHPVCNAHEDWSPVIEMPGLSADTKLHHVMQQIKNHLGVDSVEINLRNNKFVEKISSRLSNTSFSPLLPESKITNYISISKELRDMQYDEGFYQNSYENIDETFPYLFFTLKQVGIPDFDVIQVTAENGFFYFELSKDKKKYEGLIAKS
ncbi:MAG: HesA/MoeB/ThiF family protein [Tannerella sp.]|jgi:adenylyltransferase/sulfurtransferase|nr:HesA/MoeB/ThiF family protein [Tannerella sp.]